MSQWIPPLVQFQTSTNLQSITICLLQKHPSQIQTAVREEKLMIITLVHKKNEINIEDLLQQINCWRKSCEKIPRTFKSFRDDELEEKNGKEKQQFEREENVLLGILLDGNAEHVQNSMYVFWTNTSINIICLQWKVIKNKPQKVNAIMDHVRSLTHPSVLPELDFIIHTRGGGSWYF